ncbi:hypothetical protein P167DRAFT_221719 [Morchella conica CCBAS932]|uniref:Uncharacterized protein n=1 Tax=Morchella conica CCBAS932 TaxID=1392247 RepID=A0A3N4KLB5_9PEZI|nr:hypothetical protein P167DRAFT_221719 [Morchella conica CCBAS932]
MDFGARELKGVSFILSCFISRILFSLFFTFGVGGLFLGGFYVWFVFCFGFFGGAVTSVRLVLAIGRANLYSLLLISCLSFCHLDFQIGYISVYTASSAGILVGEGRVQVSAKFYIWVEAFSEETSLTTVLIFIFYFLFSSCAWMAFDFVALRF